MKITKYERMIFMKQQTTEEQLFTNTQSKAITYSRYRKKILEELEEHEDALLWLKNAKCRLMEKRHMTTLSSIWMGILGSILSFALVLTYHPFLLFIILCAFGAYFYDANVGKYYDTRLEVINDLIKEYKYRKKTEGACEKMREEKDTVEVKKEKKMETPVPKKTEEETVETSTEEVTEEKTSEEETQMSEETEEEMEEDEIDLTKMD